MLQLMSPQTPHLRPRWVLLLVCCLLLVGAANGDCGTVCPSTNNPPPTSTTAITAPGSYYGSDTFTASRGDKYYGVVIQLNTAAMQPCEGAQFEVGLYSGSGTSLQKVASTDNTIVYSTQADGTHGGEVYLQFSGITSYSAQTSTTYRLIVGFSQPTNLQVYTVSGTASGQSTTSTYYTGAYSPSNPLPSPLHTNENYFTPLAVYPVTCSFTCSTLAKAACSSSTGRGSWSSSASMRGATSSSSGSKVSSSSSSGVWALHSSSTANGAIYSDPYFSGFWGQTFYVHGRAHSVYSLISDSSVQLNSRFVFLQNVSCPVLPDGVEAHVHCSSHPGTYMGSMSIKSSNGDLLHIMSGSVEVGFGSVTVNGQQLIGVNDSYGLPNGASVADSNHPSRNSLYVHRSSARSLVVHTGVYEMMIDNSDLYVDLVWVGVTNWTELIQTLQPTGLMGRTWNNSHTIHLTAAQEDEYREKNDDLDGCNVDHDKFCKAQQPVSESAAAAAQTAPADAAQSVSAVSVAEAAAAVGVPQAASEAPEGTVVAEAPAAEAVPQAGTEAAAGSAPAQGATAAAVVPPAQAEEDVAESELAPPVMKN